VNHRNIEYGASKKECATCPMRPECTRSKGPRTVQRSARKDELDLMIKEATSLSSKRDLKARKHLMERSFALSKRFGFDQARWRGLWNVGVQEYLTCAIQNIRTLINHGRKRTKGVVNLSAKIMKQRMIQATGLFMLLLALHMLKPERYCPGYA